MTNSVGSRRHIIGAIGGMNGKIVPRTGHVTVDVEHWAAQRRRDVFVFTDATSARLFAQRLGALADLADATGNDTP